jgi:hypothetical protein
MTLKLKKIIKIEDKNKICFQTATVMRATGSSANGPPSRTITCGSADWAKNGQRLVKDFLIQDEFLDRCFQSLFCFSSPFVIEIDAEVEIPVVSNWRPLFDKNPCSL